MQVRPIRTPRLAAWATALILVLISAVGITDDKARAIRHFQTGLQLLKSENLDGAASEFEASVELYESKNALFNLANCYEALHRYQDALDAFHKLERVFGDSLSESLRDAVNRHKSEIGKVVAELQLRVSKDGASISLGGKPVGSSPLKRPLLLGPGRYEVVVSLKGYETISRRVRLVSGQQAVESFELEPAKGEISVSVNVDGAAVTVDGAGVGTTPLEAPLKLVAGDYLLVVSKQGYEPVQRMIIVDPGEKRAIDLALAPVIDDQAGPPPEPGRSAIRAVFWTGLGLTVAAGITGGVFWGLADTAADDFEKNKSWIEDHPFDGETTEGQRALADQNTAGDDCKLYSKLAIGFGIGAGALALATGIVLAVDLSSEDAGPVELSAAPGGVRLSF